MNLLSIDWTTLLTTTFSSLGVSIVLAYVGYEIWKEQFHYQKKMEFYLKLISQLRNLNVYLKTTYTVVTEEERKEALNLCESLITTVEELTFHFGAYYGAILLQLIELLQDNVIGKSEKKSKNEYDIYIEVRVDEINSLQKDFKYERYSKLKDALKRINRRKSK